MSARAFLLILSLAAGPARAGDLGESVRFPTENQIRFQTAPQPGKIVFESGESAPLAQAWDTILFHGIGADAGLAFEASRRLPSGQWSPWQAVFLKRYPNGRFWGKAAFEKRVGSVRLRALDDATSAPHEVKIFSVETFSSDDKESESSQPGAPSRPAEPPLVHGRTEWKAVAPKEPYTPHTPERITLHHTEGHQTRALARSMQEIFFIQEFHMQGRGWNDIAYHFLIDAAGNIFEGRPEGVVGSHTLNENTNNIGIAMLGAYHPPKNDPVTNEQLAAFVWVARYLQARYAIGASTLKGHRDYKSTDCPGDALYALLPQLRARMAEPLILKPMLGLRAPRFE